MLKRLAFGSRMTMKCVGHDNTSKTHKGFGLIEALVASGIVAMLAAGSVALSATILNNTRTSYDQLVGTRLAMQAIEGARWIRDENVSDKNGDTKWNDLTSYDLGSRGLVAGGCVVLAPCTLGNKTDVSTSIPYYSSTTPPDITVMVGSVAHTFKREITIDTSVSDIMTITVIVDKKRPDGSFSRVANITTQLTNWKSH